MKLFLGSQAPFLGAKSSEPCMKVSIIGGAGHIGLPLGAFLAKAGHTVYGLDIDKIKVDQINSGICPYKEAGLEPLLLEVVGQNLHLSNQFEKITESDVVIFTIGTPVNEFLDGDSISFVETILSYSKYYSNQLIILRSTASIGSTREIEKRLTKSFPNLAIAYCPERIAEGFALEEIQKLPQIIGACNLEGFKRSRSFFENLDIKVFELQAEEAELAKLFTNAFRYINFSIANDFFMMSQILGLNYEKIRKVMSSNYPRTIGLQKSGFTAGPCLVKDTMHLYSSFDHDFSLGMAAYKTNESVASFLVKNLKKKYPLSELNVGILGMAFKGNSDDKRSSLAYKLKRHLKMECKQVITSDPYIQDDFTLTSLKDLLDHSDLVIIGAPHSEFRDIDFKTSQIVIDIWAFLESSH